LTLVYACIAPHGADLIPQLSSRRITRLFLKTREGIRTLAGEMAASVPDTIIIASPHNLRLMGKIGIVVAENSTGTLGGSSKKSVRLSVKCDTKLARELLDWSVKAGLPAVGANYGTSEGPGSDMPMDWGTLVPLWFPIREKRVRAKVVIVTPSRETPLVENFKFGRVVGKLAETREAKVAFIASADQAHAHSKKGPYGYSRRASEYDNQVCKAISKNRLRSILKIDPHLVEEAKPDSLWQMAILAGILEEVRMSSELVSYEVPTYYGMVCAAFHRLR